LKDRRSKDDKMSETVWETVKTREIRIAEIEGREKEERRRR